MTGWRVDVAVWIIVGLKSHVALNVFWLNEKQFGPTEVMHVNVVRSIAPVKKLLEMGNAWMASVLVGHEPTGSGVCHGRWMDD